MEKWEEGIKLLIDIINDLQQNVIVIQRRFQGGCSTVFKDLDNMTRFIKKRREWEPAINAKRPDHIISSEYPTGLRYKKGFKSLAKEKDDMFLLLSMEYGRKWRAVRDGLGDETKLVHMTETDFLCRKYVIRGLLLKRKKRREKEKLFKMKRFADVPPRIILRTKKEIEKTKKRLSADVLKDTEDEVRKEMLTDKTST